MWINTTDIKDSPYRLPNGLKELISRPLFQSIEDEAGDYLTRPSYKPESAPDSASSKNVEHVAWNDVKFYLYIKRDVTLTFPFFEHDEIKEGSPASDGFIVNKHGMPFRIDVYGKKLCKKIMSFFNNESENLNDVIIAVVFKKDTLRYKFSSLHVKHEEIQLIMSPLDDIMAPLGG